MSNRTEDFGGACNVADRLAQFSVTRPDAIAIACASKKSASGYETISFADLESQSNNIARGLLRSGVEPGMRLAMLVPFGIDFIRLVLALLKAGVVQVLIDPGMGRKNMIGCLAETDPHGFVGIPRAQLARLAFRKRFPNAIHNIRVGGMLPFGGTSLKKIESMGAKGYDLPTTRRDESAAVIFTTGSTGPPKGVAYTHGTFENQVRLIQEHYQIEEGTVDLACFPLFGLFDAVMGVTTVVPDMDPTRPADVNPKKVLKAVSDWNVTQAFGSPALWHKVSGYCNRENIRLTGVRRIMSAGAPVPSETLAALRQMIHEDGEIFTPYGATESLPVASIESREVLGETASKSIRGAGTCVGSRFPDMNWRVIQIDDKPIDDVADVVDVPRGGIGELMVSGPVVTKQYATRKDQNPIHKVTDGDRIWHRMGDVGYLDEQDRFWFCGRKAHRVETAEGLMFTICCEAIFNQHPCIYRSALVGVKAGDAQRPVMIVEPFEDGRPKSKQETDKLIEELKGLGAANELTKRIDDIRIYPKKLPVDIRHNSKIFREQLAIWAQQL